MNLSKMCTNKINGQNDDSITARLPRLFYPLGLLALVLMVLLFIEYKHPYFFLQDDNRDYFLPYYIHNYKSLLNGEIALYNFHHFLGTPALAVGQSAVLYPITYLSVFLSSLLFGHYFTAIDIQVIIHLLIGAIGFYQFMRFLNIERKIALFGGLTWSLSPFAVYVSNSWVVVSAVAAYFPWMLLLSFRIHKTSSIKTTICAVLARLLLFYAGHIQYFIYSVIFEFLTVLVYVVSDSLPGEKKVSILKFLKNYIIGYIFVFIFSLPLLLPMWHQTTISAYRNKPLPFDEFFQRNYPISQILQGLFFPFIQTENISHNSPLSYIGSFSLFFVVIGLIEKIKKSKIVFINSIKLSVFIIPALIAFLWASNKIFNLFIYVIPILNRFRWPFKIAFYLDFYLIIIATIMLSYFILQIPRKKSYINILFCLIIGTQVLTYMVLYTVCPYNFGYHGDRLPLEEKLQDKLTGGRIISIDFDTWSSALDNDPSNFLSAPTLGFNYATLWDLDHFAGYEPLISTTNSEACLGLNFKAFFDSDDPIPVDYFRKAAVRWYLIPKSKSDKYTKELNGFGIIKKYEDENRAIFYDANAYPMIFNLSGDKIGSENYQITTNRIELSIESQQSDVIIFNNIYNPFFEGYIDGKETKLTPINDIHMSIPVPEGKHHVLIRYRDPYFVAGTYIAITFLLLTVFIYQLSKRLKPKIPNIS